jgi:hypothetical protein
VVVYVAAIAIGCSSRADRQGTVRLALTIPPGGPSVSAVQWRIGTSLGAFVASGTIQTGDVNATATVDTSCPAGSGFVVTLAATATDGTSCSGRSQPFNVSVGATVPVPITLVCGGGVPAQTAGSVVVTATVVAGDNCPVIKSWEVSPLRTSSGQPIDVSVTASDADSADVLSYRWTATSGSFTDPTAATTQYHCSFGRVDLSVIVSDGHSPKPCQAATSFSVYCAETGICGDGIVEPGEMCDPPNGGACDFACQDRLCGDGVVEPGEACDPPNGSTCTSSCQRPFCGNNIIEPGEQCDPPTSPGCNSACQFASCGDGVRDTGEECDPPDGTTCRPGCILARCGDGVVDPGETCDPPDGAACGPNCLPPAVCGDGIIEPGERCDPPSFPSCNATCQLCEGYQFTSCDMCEQADHLDCPVSLEVVPGNMCGWGCGGFPTGSPANIHCQALLNCIVHSGCMVGTYGDDPTPCLCGSLSPGACVLSGAPPTAPCAAEYAAAAADAPGTVFQQFTLPSSPVGIADNIAACDVDSSCVCR